MVGKVLRHASGEAARLARTLCPPYRVAVIIGMSWGESLVVPGCAGTTEERGELFVRPKSAILTSTQQGRKS